MTAAIKTIPPLSMAITFRPGRTYTLMELVVLARRGLETRRLTHQQAADYLSKNFPMKRSDSRTFHRAQVGAALSNPERNPRMVMLLVEAFTDYKVHTPARYLLDRKEK